MRMLFGVVGALAFTTPAFAQSAAPPASLAPEDPDFDRILANPDDPVINLKFAQDEAAAGRLLSAAAALERLLIVNPDWHAVRLFYASVLFRLDDRQTARRELALLKTKNLNADQRAEVDRYTRQLDRRADALRVAGQVSLGVAYDNNAQGALSSSLDVGLGRYQPDDGVSLVALAQLDLARPFGSSGIGAFGTLSALSKSDVSGPDQGYQRGDLGLGLSGGGATGSWRLGGVLHHVVLFGDRYLTEYGGRAEISRRAGAQTSFGASVEAVHQDYAASSLDVLAPVANPRTGRRVDGAVSVTHRLTARQTLSGQIGYEDKQANYKPFGYNGPYIFAAYSAQLGRGSSFSLAATARRLNYDAVDPIFSAITRKDTRSFVRAALGAPLSAFSAKGVTGDIRERLRLEGAISYSRSDTREPYVDFDSVGAELRLLWRFGG